MKLIVLILILSTLIIPMTLFTVYALLRMEQVLLINSNGPANGFSISREKFSNKKVTLNSLSCVHAGPRLMARRMGVVQHIRRFQIFGPLIRSKNLSSKPRLKLLTHQ